MGTREYDLQPLGQVFNLHHVRANAVVNAEAFGGDHVLAEHDTFRLQIQSDGRLA